MSRGTGSPAAVRDIRARVLVCPDKFRGSLTAVQAAEALADGLLAGGVPRPWILPVADGGEGTVDCCLTAGFTEFRRRVTGADGHSVLARIAIHGPVAVIESAQACGLGEGPHDDRAALAATSFGVGELIRAALDAGCSKLIVGVGGTASTDGGAGLLQALGARLSDSRGNPVAAGGAGLAALEQADLSGLDPRLAECDLIAGTDVDNPLLGRRGAAAVFAPQKGAGWQAQAQLERGLAKLADLLDRPTVPRLSDLPGAGAGGGIAYALITAGAQRVSGADTVLEMLCFADHARAAERSMREAPFLLRRAGTDIAAWLSGQPRRPLRSGCGGP